MTRPTGGTCDRRRFDADHRLLRRRQRLPPALLLLPLLHAQVRLDRERLFGGVCVRRVVRKKRQADVENNATPVGGAFPVDENIYSFVQGASMKAWAVDDSVGTCRHRDERCTRCAALFCGHYTRCVCALNKVAAVRPPELARAFCHPGILARAACSWSAFCVVLGSAPPADAASRLPVPLR